MSALDNLPPHIRAQVLQAATEHRAAGGNHEQHPREVLAAIEARRYDTAELFDSADQEDVAPTNSMVESSLLGAVSMYAGDDVPTHMQPSSVNHYNANDEWVSEEDAIHHRSASERESRKRIKDSIELGKKDPVHSDASGVIRNREETLSREVTDNWGNQLEVLNTQFNIGGLPQRYSDEDYASGRRTAVDSLTEKYFNDVPDHLKGSLRTASTTMEKLIAENVRSNAMSYNSESFLGKADAIPGTKQFAQALRGNGTKRGRELSSYLRKPAQYPDNDQGRKLDGGVTSTISGVPKFNFDATSGKNKYNHDYTKVRHEMRDLASDVGAFYGSGRDANRRKRRDALKTTGAALSGSDLNDAIGMQGDVADTIGGQTGREFIVDQLIGEQHNASARTASGLLDEDGEEIYYAFDSKFEDMDASKLGEVDLNKDVGSFDTGYLGLSNPQITSFNLGIDKEGENQPEPDQNMKDHQRNVWRVGEEKRQTRQKLFDKQTMYNDLFGAEEVTFADMPEKAVPPKKVEPGKPPVKSGTPYRREYNSAADLVTPQAKNRTSNDQLDQLKKLKPNLNFSDNEQGTPAWKDERKPVATATEAGYAISGYNAYGQDALTGIAEGQKEDAQGQQDHSAFAIGEIGEKQGARMLKERTGLDLFESGLITNPKYQNMGISPDRMHIDDKDKLHLQEFKTSSVGDDRNDAGLFAKHKDQMMMQMMVSEAESNTLQRVWSSSNSAFSGNEGAHASYSDSDWRMREAGKIERDSDEFREWEANNKDKIQRFGAAKKADMAGGGTAATQAYLNQEGLGDVTQGQSRQEAEKANKADNRLGNERLSTISDALTGEGKGLFKTLLGGGGGSGGVKGRLAGMLGGKMGGAVGMVVQAGAGIIKYAGAEAESVDALANIGADETKLKFKRGQGHLQELGMSDEKANDLATKFQVIQTLNDAEKPAALSKLMSDTHGLFTRETLANGSIADALQEVKDQDSRGINVAGKLSGSVLQGLAGARNLNQDDLDEMKREARIAEQGDARFDGLGTTDAALFRTNMLIENKKGDLLANKRRLGDAPIATLGEYFRNEEGFETLDSVTGAISGVAGFPGRFIGAGAGAVSSVLGFPGNAVDAITSAPGNVVKGAAGMVADLGVGAWDLVTGSDGAKETRIKVESTLDMKNGVMVQRVSGDDIDTTENTRTVDQVTETF